MEHLRLRSGGRHSIDAVNIISEMGTLFAEAHSIAEYINAMEELQKKSLRAELPIADEMLLAIATKAVLASDRYPRTTDVWEEMLSQDKSWSEWKDTYTKADNARERRLQAAGDQGGNFGSANAATSGGRGVQFALAASGVPPEMVPTAETMEKLDAYLDNMSDSLANAATSGHLEKSELVSLAASLA